MVMLPPIATGGTIIDAFLSGNRDFVSIIGRLSSRGGLISHSTENEARAVIPNADMSIQRNHVCSKMPEKKPYIANARGRNNKNTAIPDSVYIVLTWRCSTLAIKFTRKNVRIFDILFDTLSNS